MLKKIFGTKRVKATAEWKHLHHEKVHYLHSLSNIIQVKKKVSQSCYRPGQAQRVLRKWKLRFPDFMTMAQDGSKVVSLKHQPPLPPGNTPGTHFH